VSFAPRRTLLILVPLAAVLALLAVLLLPGGASKSHAAEPAAADVTKPVTISGPFGRVALGGAWTVAEDARNQGLDKNWKAGTFPGKDVTIPYVPNAGRITGAGGVISHRGSIAWYRTKITVDSDGQYAIAFGSVNHKATVWVDGKQVAKHTGEFLPFDARTSLKAGEHTLVVRADWRDPEKMKADGWHRLWFNFGGINREVTIRKLGPSEVQAPYVTTTLPAGGGAKVRVSALVVNRSVERDLQLSGVMRREGQEIAFQFPKVRLKPRASQRVETEVTVDDPQLWSPGSPSLYDLTLAVPNESAYQTRIGLRQVEKRGTNIFLNGERITLRGASIHEDAPGAGTGLRPEQMDSLVGDLKEIGANATRAQHPLSPALLERLDAAGILLWQGVGPTDSPGSWKSDTPAKAAVARQRVQTTLDEQQTHPSIIVWNLVNEIARNGGKDNGQVPFIRAMSQKLKREDPGKLIALDVWATPVKYKPNDPVGGARVPDRMGPVYQYVDAIGITSYQGWYSDPGKPMSFLKDSIGRFTSQIKKIYAGKILVLTEFGAEANGENPTNRPGGYAYQANLLKTTIDTYSADPKMSGSIVWNLRDFGVAPTFIGGSIQRTLERAGLGRIRLVRGLNQKGLFTYSGQPKPSVAPVREALKRAADGTAGR
jgi:hypothetical protein